MKIDDVIQKIGDVGIVPVIRAANMDEASRAVEAICAGGIPIVEITMTVPGATKVIQRVVQQYGDQILTGAGTVLTSDDANACLDAGAEFLVSPGFSIAVLQAARLQSKLAIPGALTPTEVMRASAEGARLVKIFPCGNLGGPKYIKALKAPFPNIELIPTGGVNASTAVAYVEAGAFALGVGADLVDVSALRDGNSEKVINSARDLVEIVRAARDLKKQPTG